MIIVNKNTSPNATPTIPLGRQGKNEATENHVTRTTDAIGKKK